ncbi:MAG TPA: NHL repeat-containing protein [Candidatus Dormibacteraeota bacterium]|nr:NHL repeat-containing protein [Candidatus Dormibacteraeota bacterium]
MKIGLPASAIISIITAGATSAPAATLYVSSYGNDSILKFQEDGTSSILQTMRFPTGVAFDSTGNLYVASQTGNTIAKFPREGIWSGFASTDLSGPYGLVFDKANNLYAVNGAISTIEKFSPQGTPSAFVPPGVVGGQSAITIDAADNIYIHAYLFAGSTGGVLRVTPSGEVSVFAQTTGGGANGLAFDSKSNLYVASFSDNIIEKITPSGTTSIFISDPGDGSVLNAPFGLAFDNSDNLYVANYGGNTIEKITQDGTASVFASSGLSNPTYLAFGPDIVAVPEPSAFDLFSIGLPAVLTYIGSRRPKPGQTSLLAPSVQAT